MMRGLVAVLALLAFAPAASAHSTLVQTGDTLIYASEDATSDNNLTIEEGPTTIRFLDPEADNGIQTSIATCTAGEPDSNGFSYEYTCQKAGIRHISVQLGPNEDRMLARMTSIDIGATGESGADSLVVQGPTPDVLAGDQGNDSIDGGDGNDDIQGEEGNDTLKGAGGNDKIQGGSGGDNIEGGEGDDTINTPDGVLDKVACGGGTDTVQADTVDEVGADCETVPPRQFVAPPAGGGGDGSDTTKPRVQVGGSTLQRVSARRRTLRLAATLSEVGEIAASGFLDAGGINTPIKTKPVKVKVAGGGVDVKIVLSRSQIKKVMRDLRRRRKVYVRINVVGTDTAGNAAVARTFKIRLRR